MTVATAKRVANCKYEPCTHRAAALWVELNELSKKADPERWAILTATAQFIWDEKEAYNDGTRGTKNKLVADAVKLFNRHKAVFNVAKDKATAAVSDMMEVFGMI